MNENDNVAVPAMFATGFIIAAGVTGFLVTRNHSVFWPDLSLVLVVLGSLGFVFSAVRVWHHWALDQALTKLPEPTRAAFRDIYRAPADAAMLEVHEGLMRSAQPIRMTLYLTAAGYAGLVLSELSGFGMIVATVAFAVLVLYLLGELRASLVRTS